MEFPNLKVLSIGSDRKSFDESSPVFKRLSRYAERMGSLHIIIFTKRGFTNKTIDNLHIYPTNSLNRIFYVFDAKKLANKIIKNNNLNKVDTVISTQDPFESGLVGYFLQRKFKLPLQIQVHTDFLSPYFNRGFLNRIRVSIARFVVSRAQGLRVVSSVIDVSLQKRFKDIKSKISILPVFVDIEKIIKSIPTQSVEKDFPKFKFIIFMASRLTQEKRIENALYALKKVVTEFPLTGLVIAGSGSLKNNLVKKIGKLGLEKNVVFVGWQNDLLSYYKTSDMFLLTSDYEGYGMTLIEAAASGCPIVTTEVGIAKTDLFKNGENSLVCPVGDRDCLANSVLDLIHDNSKREIFKRKMLEDIQNYSSNIEEYSSRYVNLLNNLLIEK